MYFIRFKVFVVYTNYAANPLIYYITVKSFTDFLDELVSRNRRPNNSAAAEPPIPLQTIANIQAQ